MTLSIDAELLYNLVAETQVIACLQASQSGDQIILRPGHVEPLQDLACDKGAVFGRRWPRSFD